MSIDLADSPKVLIVDDSPLNLKLLSSVLEAEQVLVVTAQDGQQALELLEQQHIDLIISDILMPRMDGYQLCLEVRKRSRLKEIPFVHYTSTYRSATDEKTAYDMGSTLFLRKPEQLQEVVSAVKRLKAGEAVGRPAANPVAPEAEVMREYSEVLIAKLEKRAHELEERTHSLEQAHQQLTLLQWAFEHSSEGMIVTDLQGQITMANQAFCSMFEYSREEVIGQRTGFLKSESSTPEFYRQMWSALSTHGEWKGEIVNRTKTGKDKECYLTITPIIDDNGNHLGYLGLESDLTQRKQLQRQVAHNEQLAAIGEAMSTLAHEVRNPLNGIRMNAYLLNQLKMGDSWSNDEAESVSLIMRETIRLHELVDSVLGFSRKQAMHYERINIRELIEEVIELEQYLASEYAAKIQLEIPQKDLTVRCDANLLKQVLINLLQNAIEATSENPDSEKYVLFHISKSEPEDPNQDSYTMLKIDLYNTGHIINPEAQQKIFKPFHTTKTQGLGLGLPTSLKIIRQHGGAITVISPPPQITGNPISFSTLFSVQLPI